jgi:hypothetical protein
MRSGEAVAAITSPTSANVNRVPTDAVICRGTTPSLVVPWHITAMARTAAFGGMVTVTLMSTLSPGAAVKTLGENTAVAAMPDGMVPAST